MRCFLKGTEGRAYHVCSEKGEQCVIKFYSRRYLDAREKKDADANKKKFVTEMNLWKEINGSTISKVELNSRAALLMPYIEPLTANEKGQFLDKKSTIYKEIRALIRSCMEKGVYQTDASWRYIGWYRYEKVPKVALFDFGHLSEVKQEEEEKTINFILGQLKYEVRLRVRSQREPESQNLPQQPEFQHSSRLSPVITNDKHDRVSNKQRIR